ncbi:LacI family DNA-binding transcriptional regulator [Carnobacterium gallinarum]|uniref:LacI family DNA-binding transcriptional regulator n=1 Tax=Carnobacterium gallinarum TaxID=2749 RepID=UPI00055019A0|nr:LacI family DNA-binding transcriptional regulator [Carnobacterium gallinarum]
MATIQEVANHAGVSVGSVSRYLNGYQLKPANMKKIEESIEALEYKGNPLAKALKSNQTLSIGLLMNNMQSNFSASMVAQIEDELERFGYSILLSGFRNDYSQVERKLDFLLSRKIDGLIIFEAEQDWEAVQQLKNVDIPVISVNTPMEFDMVDSIVVNNKQSTKEVIEKMLQFGHEKIGIIAAPQTDYVARERLDGVLEAFAENNYPIEDAVIYYGDYSKQSGYTGMKHLLKNEEITAVFVCNYNMSLGALQEIYEQQLKIGEDISFASYDYFDASDIFNPKLTVIRQPVKEIGTLAANRMMEKIRNHGQLQGDIFVVPNDILWRDSVKERNNKNGED